MKPLLILTAALLAVPLLIVVLTAGTEAPAATGGLAGEPTALAHRDIPPRYLAWFMDAAQTCPGLPWNMLAGIGKVESDHGRNPAARRPNFAGTRGPMQFLPPPSPPTASTAKAYELAKKDQFPCPVLRVGASYRVPLAGLLKLLGIEVSPSR